MKAAFVTIVNIILLCAAVMLLNKEATGEDLRFVSLNGTESNVYAPINAQAHSGKITKQIVYICIYASILLSSVPAVFGWLMHGDILEFVWTKLSSQTADLPRSGLTPDISHLHAAQANGSLFWLVNFILPSVMLMLVGMLVLIWSVHGYIVATCNAIQCCISFLYSSAFQRYWEHWENIRRLRPKH
jgi:hypothetical protein